MAEQPEEHVDEQLGDEVEPERPALDPETAARRAGALAQVRQFGDPVLKAKAVPVERFDDQLRAEVARMAGIMGDAIGVGLAATQLGVMHRVLVYKVGEDGLLAAVVNPELEWAGDDIEEAEEGCLSLPGVHVDVERPVRVRVRARDEHGDKVVIEASGLEARVIQHEMDHLDGVLIIDRTSKEERKEALRILREGAEILEPRTLGREQVTAG